MSATRLRWSEVPHTLRGPYEPPEAEAERVFELVGEGGPLVLGRLVSGEAWPAELPRLDRLAAVPDLGALAPSSLADANAVLRFEAAGGERRALCVPAGDGSLRWAVDPSRWIRALLDEAYIGAWARPLPSRLPGLNYARLPHALKGLAERLLSRLPSRDLSPFPELPLDTLVDQLRRLCQALAGGPTAPPASLWPEGRRAAVTLTHDVDSGWILDPERSSLLREILERETALGFAGAWYVVAARVDPARHRDALAAIREAGHELGAHGWNHDAKLGFLGEKRQERRLARARARLEGLGVEGIRTPWYWRSPALFRVLERHFAYDSSVPTASGLYGTATRTGCCTVFPYAPRPGLMELPLTLSPDTALEGGDLVSAWRPVVDEIVEAGGVVVPILHPQPHQSASVAGLAAWYDFLADLRERHGPSLWSAPPARIAARYAEKLNI